MSSSSVAIRRSKPSARRGALADGAVGGRVDQQPVAGAAVAFDQRARRGRDARQHRLVQEAFAPRRPVRGRLAGQQRGVDADLQRLIVGQVVQTTVSARALAVQLRIARETLAVQDDNLQIAGWRLQAGLTSSLDVEQARAQRAQTAATIPALERDLAASANTISTLIGEAPGPVRTALVYADNKHVFWNPDPDVFQ